MVKPLLYTNKVIVFLYNFEMSTMSCWSYLHQLSRVWRKFIDLLCTSGKKAKWWSIWGSQFSNGGLHKWRLVCSGQSYWNGCFRGTPILGNHQMHYCSQSLHPHFRGGKTIRCGRPNYKRSVGTIRSRSEVCHPHTQASNSLGFLEFFGDVLFIRKPLLWFFWVVLTIVSCRFLLHSHLEPIPWSMGTPFSMIFNGIFIYKHQRKMAKLLGNNVLKSFFYLHVYKPIMFCFLNPQKMASPSSKTVYEPVLV